MTEVPIQLIVAAFNDEKAADAVLKDLKQAKREKLIGIQNAAVLRKDKNGKLHIKETADMRGGKGAVLGGVTGAVVGLLAGPALVVPAAVGALVGGLAAKLRDSGFSDERLKRIGEGLQPESSAIIAIVEHKWVQTVEEELAEAGADLFTESLGTDIAEQLEAGHDVAYSALSTQEGFSAERIAGGEDMVDYSGLVVGEDEVVGGRFVATEEGFAVVGMEADEEGATVVGATGTFEEEQLEEGEEKKEE
ncbi:MAG: DUF1269 domain-containing protein [Anaerolineales bacterium]